MLDDKDKLILEYLMHDCRITTTKLAKITHLSQPSVVYRIRKLEDEKYIQQYDAMIDFNKFNIPMVVIFVKIPIVKQIEFEEYCKVNKNLVGSLFKHANLYNYSITSILTEQEVNELINYLGENDYQFFYHVCKKTYITPFSIFDLKISNIQPKYDEQILELDENDIKILNRLQYGGGKDSILELAKNTNLTYDLVLYRYKKLKKAGYFKLFYAQANLEKFHIQSDFLIFDVKDIAEKDVVKKITNIQKSISFFSFGNNKYGVTILSKDMREYKSIIKRILKDFDGNITDLKEYLIDDVVILNRFDLMKILKK